MADAGENSGRNATTVAAVLLLIIALVAAYFVAYGAMLMDTQLVVGELWLVEPVYRSPHPAVKTFFRPANWCDRQVRPAKWQIAIYPYPAP